MPFTREIQRTVIGLLAAFFVVGLAASYWAIAGPDTIIDRDDNPRLVEAEAAIMRGSLYDRNDLLLAETVSSSNGTTERNYLFEAMHSALGYYSFRYGVNGVESAYDDFLKGDNLPIGWEQIFQQDVLHRPTVGSDIRLTFDLEIQQAVVNAMQGHTGAAIVLGVPQGDVLALVSLPTYDPNILDNQWAELIEAPDDPFFNRVLQGAYQPGSTLQTPLLAAAILAGININTPVPDANRSIEIEGLTLECVQSPPTTELTLVESYTYGCPAPFVDLTDQLGEVTVNEYLDRIGNRQIPTLLDYNDPVETPEATGTPFGIEPLTLVEEITGQGIRSVSPLTLASMMSAIMLEGSAPQPYTLLATRAPEDDWQVAPSPSTNLPFFTTETATSLRQILQTALQSTELGNIALPEGTEIGGQIAISYSGDETQSWFAGFVRTSSNGGAAIVVVLEQTEDISIVTDVAQEILLATQAKLHQQADNNTG